MSTRGDRLDEEEFERERERERRAEMTPQPSASSTSKVCSICDDEEPFHVHRDDRRIEDYFTVGRGQTDFEAAAAWKARALAAERVAETPEEWARRARVEVEARLGGRLRPGDAAAVESVLAAVVERHRASGGCD